MPPHDQDPFAKWKEQEAMRETSSRIDRNRYEVEAIKLSMKMSKINNIRSWIALLFSAISLVISIITLIKVS